MIHEAGVLLLDLPMELPERARVDVPFLNPARKSLGTESAGLRIAYLSEQSVGKPS